MEKYDESNRLKTEIAEKDYEEFIDVWLKNYDESIDEESKCAKKITKKKNHETILNGSRKIFRQCTIRII